MGAEVSAPAPIPCRYEGEGQFTAVSAFTGKRADRDYVVGEVYRLAPFEDRSAATHNHEFAAIADLWANLPERFSDEPWAQSAEHLRKFALIMTKQCDTQTFACSSKAEAERWARNLRPLDEYSLVKVEEATVYRFTAQSQSRRAMGKAKFQASKTAIIEWIEDLIGADRGSAERSEAA